MLSVIIIVKLPFLGYWVVSEVTLKNNKIFEDRCFIYFLIHPRTNHMHIFFFISLLCITRTSLKRCYSVKVILLQGQLSSDLCHCLPSFLGIYSQIKPAGFKKVFQGWVLPWPGTGAAIIDNSSLSYICLDKQNPFPFSDVFNLSRYVALINISDCLSAGDLWTLHHSYSHDGLTFLLEAKNVCSRC